MKTVTKGRGWTQLLAVNMKYKNSSISITLPSIVKSYSSASSYRHRHLDFKPEEGPEITTTSSKMYLSTTCFFVALASIAAAFTLPETASDGFYVSYYNETGHEVHVKNPDLAALNAILPTDDELAQVQARNPAPDPQIARRADMTWCGCGHKMDRGECDQAVEDIKNRFRAEGGGLGAIAPNTSWWARRAGVVAFACNHSPDTTSITDAVSYAQGLVKITSACGLYIAGTLEFSPFLDIGYMNWRPGVKFCEGARSSPAHSC